MNCPYCASLDHENIHSLVRHVLMCHVPRQNGLHRVMFRNLARVTEEDQVTINAKCLCGRIISGKQLSFNSALAEHLRGCGEFPELLEALQQ